MFFSSRDTRDTRTIWGHTFEWTPEHLTKEQMRPLTMTYDVLAAECLDRLDKLSPPPSETPPPPPPPPQVPDDKPPDSSSTEKPRAHARRDLYALLSQHHASDPKLTSLWTQLHTVPDWVDWAQISRGQDVFARYGVPAVLSLTFQSLVGGMAGWRVVETLSRTGGFSAPVARRRLLETFQHVLQVTRDLDSVRPGGDGFASSVRVRLLHARVRTRILALAARDPSYFDLDACGMPVSDLDCLGTVLSFSAAVVWLGLPRQGIFLREHEVADYHALWRWVAHLLGVPAAASDLWLSDWRRAKVLMESLMLAELQPSDKSRALANNTLTALSRQPPGHVSREFMCAEAHWLIGTELADALEIQRPSLLHWVLVGLQCLYLMGTCYLCRSIPSWDRRKNEVRCVLLGLTRSHSALLWRLEGGA